MNTTHLIEGEIFSINKDTEESKTLSDQEIDDKYRKGEMRIVTEQGRIDLHSIVSTLSSKTNEKQKYKLDPEYQRRKRWDNRRKSLLIESFIMNVPIPPIFLYEVEYAFYEVMDGQQRLTAIRDFYENKFALEGLDHWSELNGKYYNELPKNIKAGIDRRYLSSIVLLEETAKNKEEADFLKKIVFGRLNSGGEKLNPQEMRNALLGGSFNDLCLKLAKNDIFRKLWYLPTENQIEEDKLLLKSEEELKETEFSYNTIESYRKMQDVELVLRFFAYRHLDKLGAQIDIFLDKFLKEANNFPKQTLQKLETLFIDTIETLYEVLGNKAFLFPKLNEKQNSKSPAKTMYDGIMQAFAQNVEYRVKIIENKNEIKESLYKDEEKLYREGRKNPYLFDGRYSSKKDVQERIDYFNELLKDNIK